MCWICIQLFTIHAARIVDVLFIYAEYLFRPTPVSMLQADSMESHADVHHEVRKL